MTDFLASRDAILDGLRREMVGPDPSGSPIDMTSEVVVDDDHRFDNFFDSLTGEEILRFGRPTGRYGIGVLYPTGVLVDAPSSSNPTDENEAHLPEVDRAGDTVGLEMVRKGERQIRASGRASSSDDDFDLTSANQLRPSAMGISFLMSHRSGADVEVEFTGGRYEQRAVSVGGDQRNWWLRVPVRMTALFDGAAISALAATGQVPAQSVSTEDLDPAVLEVQLVARPFENGSSIVTVAVVNRSEVTLAVDTTAIFQAGFEVRTTTANGAVPDILPYPEHRADVLVANDSEARSIALLYSKTPTFAIGHGCAADWSCPYGVRETDRVRAESFPVYEAPSVTPDVILGDGVPFEVPMGPLAGLDEGDDGFASLERLIVEYRSWIENQRREASRLEDFADVATQHLDLCESMADRMERGFERLQSDDLARRAFQFANRAILLQQLRSRPGERATTLDESGRWVVAEQSPVPHWRDAHRGRWRAFQIGFLLAAMCSTLDGSDGERETVDLIFFPTGGGKTEAYLGLSALSLFYDRLKGEKRGVSVLMRYTLRLLTTQQFVRASALICAMECIRQEEDLGEDEFSIGIWVGNTTTPGTRERAKSDLRTLIRAPRETANPFLLLKCPWCSAQLGPIERTGRGKPGATVAGYRESNGRVQFHCPDASCEFHESLPIYVVDEDVYEKRPSIVIGTVDKFARLTWEPRARRLFGIDDEGNQESAPPNLIIQDELHLISGPLGSMVGLYEGIVEDLCTDRRGADPIPPKIVASTATIRKYQEQSHSLFGRGNTVLFPPHGIDASDSFFAQYARNGDGTLKHGRRYVGLSAPGLGSMLTAEVRAFSSLLQAAKDLPENERDPWWTVLAYFNSLRELGIGVSLMQSDVREYLDVIRVRRSAGFEERRRIPHVMELTSRLESDQVPLAFKKLERTADEDFPVDVCLASNIIEVGIDISRLSLMTVAGQPKSTSSYIQITGRVGREWQTRPGLVVTVYSPTKPRDRSHFERFRSYHQRLYGQVEPVSVTPFASPVLRRALHAAIVAYVRQRGPIGLEPAPTPERLIEHAIEILEPRLHEIDEESGSAFRRILAWRLEEWRNWPTSGWGSSFGGDAGKPLLRMAGTYVPPDLEAVSWPTPSSMRDVDATCRTIITTLYANDFVIAAEGVPE